MTSLSKVIKSSHYKPLDNTKIIEAAKLPEKSRKTASAVHQAADLEQAIRHKEDQLKREQFLLEAQLEADELKQAAKQEMDTLREKAQEEIANWWDEKRQEADEAAAIARKQAEEDGYADGLLRGEEAMRTRYEQTLQMAVDVLQQAHDMKRELIAEAEPFLLELSTRIAEKIIGRQLTIQPEWVVDQIRLVLARERSRGIVTLCVAPEHFAPIRESREELSRLLDPMADLRIIPDSSLRGSGCVVRTEFGSLDARIDSQLAEIKQALLNICLSDQEEQSREQR